MWSCLTARSFISPLSGYVESKVALSKVLGLDEIALLLVRFDHTAGFVEQGMQRVALQSVAVDSLRNSRGIKQFLFDVAHRACGDPCDSVVDARDSPRNKDPGKLSRYWLLWLAPVMQQRLFWGPHRQLVSYDDEFTVRWRRGFDWKQWS
jgi:hypothetical protein